MKLNVKSVVVLTVICIVVSVLLSVTNFYTAPVIEEAQAKAVQDSLREAMPDAADFEEIELGEDAPETVQHLYKETSGLGYVVALTNTSQYSSGDMGITVAISPDGVITGITLTSYYESKDFGSAYPQTYVGADASSLEGVDMYAGVTYSSTALKEALADAFTACEAAKGAN
jgi:electron transport complex protein RnfG